MKEIKHTRSYHIVGLILGLAFIYHTIASIRWRMVHPKANEMTTVTHICDVWSWQTIDEYRVNE